MIEEELRQHCCVRKEKFTKKQALKALASLKKSLILPLPELGIYRCKFCSRFHIGKDKVK